MCYCYCDPNDQSTRHCLVSKMFILATLARKHYLLQTILNITERSTAGNKLHVDALTLNCLEKYTWHNKNSNFKIKALKMKVQGRKYKAAVNFTDCVLFNVPQLMGLTENSR